jgi:uncharacterized protein (DUF1697 family)
MPALEDCFRGLGYQEVSSYINTGNVIFRANPGHPHELAATIEDALAGRFPERILTLVRDLEAMRALVEDIDRIWSGGAQDKRNVIFLAPEIDNERVLDGLQPKPDIEAVRYRPGTLLWSARKEFLTRSQMLKLSRVPIYQGMSIRSPGTTRRLYELMLQAEAANASDGCG